MQQIYQNIPARPMPGQSTGAVAWLKTNLFANLTNSIMTLLVLAVAVLAVVKSMDWALLNAVFGAQLEACNNMRGIGACWGVVTEKGRLS